MSAPIYSTVVSGLFNLIDQMLNSFVYNGYAVLVDHLRYPLGLAVILYITILGISLSQGWIEVKMGTFVKATMKIGLIYMFAMNWGNFSSYVVNGIEGSAGQIGDWLANASPVPLPHFAGTGDGINGALQSVLDEVTKIGSRIWGMGGFENFGPWFEAVGTWFFGYLALVVAIVEILLAKMMLAILFILAPLIIPFTLFEKTHGMFDRWLGAILGFAFFLVMIPAALALGLSLDQWVLAGQYAGVGHVTLVDWVPLMVVGVLNLAIIKSISNYATSIGGSISSGSGSSMLAAGVGGFIGGSISSAKFGKSAFKKIKSKFGSN